MNKLKIKPLVLEFIRPEFGTEGAAGFDIFLQEPVDILRGAVTTIKLGFASEIPEGFMCLIVPRSGKGAKDGVQVRNTVGVIDSDYRGEWMAMLTIDGNDLYNVRSYGRGDALLQGVLVKKPEFEIELVGELSETVRGEGGFGSTGN